MRVTKPSVGAGIRRLKQLGEWIGLYFVLTRSQRRSVGALLIAAAGSRSRNPSVPVMIRRMVSDTLFFSGGFLYLLQRVEQYDLGWLFAAVGGVGFAWAMDVVFGVGTHDSSRNV